MNKFRAPFTISNNLQTYLSGKLFSNYKKFSFEKRAYIPNRIDLLESLLKDKIILHFGCCDHESLIEEKIRDKSHLQVKIAGIAKKCIGIDIDREALARLASLNIENCYYYDVYESNDTILENESYDAVLLGEILEHIADPVQFLKRIKARFKNAGEIIITVPNAFSSQNFYNIKKGIEEINTDHKYWFTPYTLSKVVTEAGFSLESIYFVDRSRLNFADRIVKRLFLILNKNPFTCRKWSILKSNGLVAICKF